MQISLNPHPIDDTVTVYSSRSWPMVFAKIIFNHLDLAIIINNMPSNRNDNTSGQIQGPGNQNWYGYVGQIGDKKMFDIDELRSKQSKIRNKPYNYTLYNGTGMINRKVYS
jgi:hypothetical protein